MCVHVCHVCVFCIQLKKLLHITLEEIYSGVNWGTASQVSMITMQIGLGTGASIK